MSSPAALNRLPQLTLMLGLALLAGCDPHAGAVQSGATVAGGVEPESLDSPTADPWLTDVAGELGIVFQRTAEREGSYFMPEIMGSGGGFLDYDTDGRLDLVLLDASWGAGAESAGSRLVLYRQLEDGQFIDVSRQAGLDGFEAYAVGLAAGDVDADGDADLYISCFGKDQFFMNNGDGTFTAFSDAFWSPNLRWGTAASFVDFDGDGCLDLYVANYLDYYPENVCDDNRQQADYCGPQAFKGSLGRLYRNLGGWDPGGQLFVDVTTASNLTSPSGPGLGLVCRDFDGDSRCDIYVAYDQFPNPLWLQQADGRFREDAASRGVAVSGLGSPQASMGVAWGDFNSDGVCDLFITNIRGEVNTLYLGQSNGIFRDSTSASGIALSSLTMTGFGVAAIDFDLDGDLDLAVVNGRVKREAPLPAARLGSYWNHYAEPAQLFFNDGSARFVDTSRKCGEFGARPEVARSLAAADYDDDGDVDFLSTTCAGPARLWNNTVPRTGHWLRVRAVDTVRNRDAIGARVTVRLRGDQAIVREINPSASYLSSHDPRLHFGLGAATSFDALEIEWPDGVRQLVPGGEADCELVVMRGHPARRVKARH